MAQISLLQAIRNAIETERSAAAFYRAMIRKGADAETQGFLARVADQEGEHAERIEEFARRLDRGELPGYAEGRVDLVETDFDWQLIDEIDLKAAVAMAVELEQKARDYYEALADSPSDDLQSLFTTLMRVEEEHRQGFVKLLEML